LGSYISRYLKKAFQDDLLTQSAALAYYASLSVPPLVLLALAAMSLLGLDLSGPFIVQVEHFLGRGPAAAIVGFVEAARDFSAYSKAGQLAGTLLLLFTASSLMAQLQSALNHIYGVYQGRSAWMALLLQRATALVVVLTCILLAVASVLASVLVSTILDPVLANWAALLHGISASVLFFIVFTLLFRLVPDCPPTWGASAAGAGFASVLFLAGKAPLASFIEKSMATSLYGAAGALMFLLIWVYYSSLIICLGAELSYFIDKGSVRSATLKQGGPAWSH
jgi:membrane protein